MPNGNNKCGWWLPLTLGLLTAALGVLAYLNTQYVTHGTLYQEFIPRKQVEARLDKLDDNLSTVAHMLSRIEGKLEKE